MKLRLTALLLCAGGAIATAQPVMETGSQRPMPQSWIDKDTGHKIVRLNGPTGNALSNWYFHNNPFFKAKGGAGDLMVFSDVDAANVRQVFAMNLKTMRSQQLTFGKSAKKLYNMSAQKTQEFIFQSADSVYGSNPFTRKTRLLYVVPAGDDGTLQTVNADASMFAGSDVDPKQLDIRRQYPEKSQFFNRIFDAHLRNSIFTINVANGAKKIIHEENNWLGHIQFSPTDPNILMFCHEGPWEKVDRIWRYNITTEETTLMHKRTMPMEIAGHEFFQPDGQVIWFDLQKPKGKTFFLSGARIKDGSEVATYEMTADEWSIHFATFPEKNLFAGDGGDPSQVAHAQNGMWIYLFRPQGNRFNSEKLVNMKHHVYRAAKAADWLEPNVHFTPDGKWIVFGGNFEGANNTYAVELEKSK